ncbi:MAG TPA: TonB-dependent receptor [Chitinophagaceae bacterium]|nr:TonB-dependent receptor [Chitinophagaceae bacterium]
MKIAWIFLFAFTFLQAKAQLTFRGQVIDNRTGQPVAGADVVLTGSTARGLATDSLGIFSFGGLAPGSYKFQVSFTGYRNFIRQFPLDSDRQDYLVRLENPGLFVEPVEITSTRVGKYAPFAATEVLGKDLSKSNLGQDLPYLLDQTPSVVVNSDAGNGVGYTGIHIRGTDETRINVTINGIPVNDAEDQGVYWVDIPDLASSAQSIQIQRGVGTSTNGAGAFGATLNVSTNDFHDSAYATLSNSYGSYSTWKHTVHAGSGLMDGHFTLDVRGSKITSLGYIDRAGSDLESAYLSAAYFSPNSSIRLNVFTGKEKTYQAWNGVPQDSLKTHPTYNGLGQEPDGSYYPNQTDNYEQDYYQLFFDHQFNPSLHFNTALFFTKGWGYYEEYQENEPYLNYGIQGPVFGRDTLYATNLTRQLWLYNYYYGDIFSLDYSGKDYAWTVGGGWDQYLGWHYGVVTWAQDGGFPPMFKWYQDFADKNDLNLYVRGEKVIAGNFHAFADLQWRNILYHINGFDDNPTLDQRNSYNFFNPKVGLTWVQDPFRKWYVSLAVAGKEPNRGDYEANQMQTPKPEQLEDLEAGFDMDRPKASFHAGLYYMYYHNQLVLTGKINDVGAYTRTNIPLSYRLGVEFSGSVDFARIWIFSGNLTLSRNRILNFTEYIDNYDNGKQDSLYHGTTDISFSPGVIGGATLSATPFKGFEIDWISKYVGKQFLDNSSNPARSIHAYFLNGIRVGYALHPRWIRALDFNLLLNNLFSVKYLNNGYTYTYIQGGQTYTQNNYFPQAPLNWLGGITLEF